MISVDMVNLFIVLQRSAQISLGNRPIQYLSGYLLIWRSCFFKVDIVQITSDVTEIVLIPFHVGAFAGKYRSTPVAPDLNCFDFERIAAGGAAEEVTVSASVMVAIFKLSAAVVAGFQALHSVTLGIRSAKTGFAAIVPLLYRPWFAFKYLPAPVTFDL